MKTKTTSFFLTNLAIPIVIGVIVNSLVGQSCVLFPIVLLPCWLWNILVIGLLVSFILDVLVYYIIPKIFRAKTKEDSRVAKKKEKSFKQKQRLAINKVSKLVADAVEKAYIFSKGYSLPDEPSMKEKAILAYDAGKDLMTYFKSGNNRLYFSNDARENITEIYETISVCIQGMDIAMSSNFNVELWNKNLEKLRKIKVLKDELDSEFHEFLATFDDEQNTTKLGI